MIMQEKGIYIFLLVIAAAIGALIVFDFNATLDKKGAGNPYELDLTPYKTVDPALIHYAETRQIRLNCQEPRSIYYRNGQLYLGADHFMQIISPDGRELRKVELPASPECIFPAPDQNIYIGFRDHVAVFDSTGKLLANWESLGQKAYITALAWKDDLLFVADAGQRQVAKFSTASGQLLGRFKGQTQTESVHGFIVPSATFDLAINEDGELWVVNPGKHSFENYNEDGSLRTYWENRSPGIEGFTGCCNPAHLALLPDGSFVTSEKKLVRIKVHKPSGELAGVVAAPNQFQEDGQAPDITVSPAGDIYALDLDRKMIRVFQKKAL
jgi:hypothetical protein